MKRKWRLALVLLTTASAAATTAGEAAPAVSRPGFATTQLAPFHVVHTRAYPLPSRWGIVTNVALLRRHVVFATCPRCDPSGTPNELVALSLPDGARQVVARTAFRRGLMDYPAATGDWVVYTDRNRMQSDGNLSVVWTLTAVNVATGRTRLLASSHGHANDNLPAVRTGEGYAVWTAPDPDHAGYGEIRAMRLSTGHKWTVRRHVRPADLGVTRGRVAWSTGARQVNSATLAGDRRTQLLHQHLADDARAADGMVAWTQASPHHPFSNPQTLWVRDIRGAHSARLLRRATAWRISVGKGFVSYLPNTSNDICATSFAAHTITFPGTNYVPAGTAARGNHLAYATSRPDLSDITVHVAAVAGE